jgi:hypothetical protein
MGGCQSKKETIKAVAIEPIYNSEVPINPSEDTSYKFIWISIHTTSKDFLKYQENGFVIPCDKSNNTYGRLWLRKPRQIK